MPTYLLPNVMTMLLRALLPLAVMASIISATPSALHAQAVGGAWYLTGPSRLDFGASIDRAEAHGGTATARLFSRVNEPGGVGAIAQTFRADSIRGQRLRIAAWVRTRAVTGAGAYLYVAVNGPNASSTGAYANSRLRARTGTTGWTLDTLHVDVPANATSVGLGLILEGAGEAWLDDMSVSVGMLDGPVKVGTPTLLVDGSFESSTTISGTAGMIALAPPRALSASSAAAIMAFARLAGYVRFFHPTDSVVATNWHVFLTEGVRAVELATTPDSLTRTLRALFAGVAPTMRIDRAGTPPHVIAPVGANAGGVAFWAHRGVRMPSSTSAGQGVYYSTREIADSAAVGHTVTALIGGLVPDPDRPQRIDLGAGITAVMPVALRVAMPANPADLHVAPKASGYRAASVNDRYTRLAAVAELWMVMEHFYPYWDIVKTDWWAMLRSGLLAGSSDDSPRQFTATLQRMVAALKDGHGRVYDARDASASYGILLRVVEGDLMITRVMDSTRTDVRRGDIVLELDGRPAKTVLAEQMALVSSATPQWAEYRALQALMTGAHDSRRSLRVRSAASADAPVRQVTLTAHVMTSAAAMPDDVRPEKITEMGPGVLYVHMGRITDQEFVALLPRLGQASGIIFDMRGYPSFSTPSLLPRLSDSTIRSARFEVPVRAVPGIGAVTYRDGAWNLAPIAPRIRAKVVFLTDGRAISYAESTMGIVEAYQLGEIVGEPTAGTNGNVNPFTLPGGHQVVWTGMRVRKHDGSPHHGVGIKPTVPVSATKKGVLAGRDEQLEAALAIVRNAPRAIVP